MATKKTVTKKTASPELAVLKESREQKLARLAAARMKNAGNKIRLIGNLAAYRPTPEQVDKIMTGLAQMCERVENRLRAAKQDVPNFTL